MFRSAARCAAVTLLSIQAHAGVISIPLGTSLPPDQVAGHRLRPAPLDLAPLYTAVDRVPLTAGLEARVSTPLTHRRVGAGWAEWAHGYLGDVYTTDGATTIEITPAPGLRALALYLAALPFTRLRIDAGIEDGPAASQFAADGGGPVGFLFFTTGGDDLPTLRIGCDGEFAIGQVLTAVPAPGAIALAAGAVVIGLSARRRG
ncbi:MAG: hypothetical protein IT436_02350 [Phycisphaerales bacterium]|nr:hypothetical protein [Phycisphaerales bacterium]